MKGSITMVNNERQAMIRDMMDETLCIPWHDVNALKNMTLDEMSAVLKDARRLYAMPPEDRAKIDSREWPDGYGIKEAINSALWNFIDQRQAQDAALPCTEY